MPENPMTPEGKLNALFAADAPPPRDLAFRLAVAERIARRRAVMRTLTAAPPAAAAAATLWGLQPVAAAMAEPLAQAAGVAAFAGATALTGLWAARRFISDARSR